jgi:hypothetical protein
MKRTALILCAAALIGCVKDKTEVPEHTVSCAVQEPPHPASDALIAAGVQGFPSYHYRKEYARFGPEEFVFAEGRIRRVPDHTSFHLMLALRKHAPARYACIPDSVKAAVFCDTLAHQVCMNDWYNLDSDRTERDFEIDLIATGEVALPKLVPLLDNSEPALSEGSQEATQSGANCYRRKDYAYLYICRILGEDYLFDRDPAVRDERIAKLQEKVAKYKVPEKDR